MRVTPEDLGLEGAPAGSPFFGYVVLAILVGALLFTLYTKVSARGWRRGIAEHDGMRIIAPLAALAAGAALVMSAMIGKGGFLSWFGGLACLFGAWLLTNRKSS